LTLEKAMKLIHLIPVLALAGTIGATHELSGSWGTPAAATPALASVVPPWLRQEGGEPGSVDRGGDSDLPPEVCAGIYGIGADGADPHAALCEQTVHEVGAASAHDGQAGLHEHDSDPHAGLYVNGDDPHAGHVHDDDPHAGHVHDDDPHAGHDVYAATVPGTDGDAYERVGLSPAPEVPLPAPVERSSAPNGRSVAQVFAERATLAQKSVRVRGTVVKINEGILGKTYLHLRDGSGSADGGDDDLTVTTTEPFQLGETVEVEGTLAINQDVGAGYNYDALLTLAARVTP
jgi:hypothetical protein